MRVQQLKRWDRTFHLTDRQSEHCPPGEFYREIFLPTRIPQDADVKAFFTDACGGVEILVPKEQIQEEREVRVFLPLRKSQ